ncbi:MAG: hypothetical protein J6N93_07840 [Clostridia bacterium]|nr:hypothetical protein [Clostridia bacterium]
MIACIFYVDRVIHNVQNSVDNFSPPDTKMRPPPIKNRLQKPPSRTSCGSAETTL